MATDEDSSHAIIERFLARESVAPVDLSVELAQLLASALIGIVGEIGFASLLARSVRYTAQTHPWLVLDPRLHPSDPEFDLLRQCLSAQPEAEVRAATRQLFNTFTDILVSLIGDHLTLVILRSALSDVIAGKSGKEQHNG